MFLNILQCIGKLSPHKRKLSGPTVNSAKAEKPWPELALNEVLEGRAVSQLMLCSQDL